MLRLIALALFGAAVCNAAVIGGGSLLGGYSKASENDKDVQQVLSFVEARMNMMSNNIYRSRVSKVVDVQRQVVNGVNYKIKFEFEGTTCSKMSMITLQSCPKSDKLDICTVQVYQPFSGEASIDDFNCAQADTTVEKRAGGISGPVSNPEAFRDQAIRALSMANSDLDASTFKVIKVRTQTVAGKNIYMTLEGLANGVLTRCDMTVWSRAWIQGDEGFQVTDNVCKPVKSKRSVLGGGCAGCTSGAMPVSAEAKAFLFQALAESNSNFQLDQSETNFISMTTQVVAGMKYTINMETKVDGKMVKCSIVVVSVPWQTPSVILHDNTCDKQ